MATKLIWLSFNLAVFRSGIYMSADQTGEVRIEYLGWILPGPRKNPSLIEVIKPEIWNLASLSAGDCHPHNNDPKYIA